MRRRLILLSITAISIFGLILVDRYYRLAVTDDNTQKLTLITAKTQEQLVVSIQSSMNALETLRAFMLTTPDLPDFATFDIYASQLLDIYPNVRTFQYVDTDRIIRHMYPLEGNEAALNLDLTTNPVAPTVERAIQERITNVNNPLITVQGTLSIVARSPLYRGDEFIGLVQVIVDIGTLIENVFQTIPNEFDIHLSDGTGHIFWGPEILHSTEQAVTIPVVDTVWTLHVDWHDAPTPNLMVLAFIWGTGSTSLLILLFAVNQNLQHMTDLTREVRIQTASLIQKNAELLAEIAEREKLEEVLLETQERERLAINAGDIGLWDWDLNTNKVYFSPEWKHQIGYKDHEISNDFSEWESRVHHDDLELAKQTAMDYIANPYPNYQNEFRFQHKDGTYRWILAQANLLYDEQGKPIRMLGSHIDITERKQAEEELHESEKMFSSAFHNGPAGMTVTRIADGKFIDANESFCNMFEFTHDEVIGHTSTDLNMLTLEERKRLIDQQIRTGGLHNFELVSQSKSGRIIIVLFSSKEINIGGEPCYLTTLIDITERKQAESMLRLSEEKFRGVYEQSPLAIQIYDGDGKLIDVNQRTLDLYGIDDKTYLLGYDMWSSRNMTAKKREALENGQMVIIPASLDFELVKKSNLFPTNKSGIIHLEAYALPFEREWEMSGYLVQMVDITERKQAEAKIQRQLKETQLLYHISQALHDLPDAQALTQQVVNILENILQYPYGAILLIDQESGDLFPFALSNQGQGDQFVELDKIFVTSQGVGLEKGITGWVARTGEAIRTGNVTENEHYIGIRGNINSELCLPLIVDNQIIGVFNTESEQPDAYDELDQQFLETVVAQIALSIRNMILVQKVHDTERNYQTLVEHASDGIFVSDASGHYVDVNSRSCLMLGYTREELIGKHLSELVADNLVAQPLRVDELKTGKSLISERQLKHKDGHLISVEISGTQLPNGNLLGIVRDITDRKQAEKKLLYERNILRTLIDNLPHQIYIKDLEGRFVLGNNPVVQAWQVESEEELIGNTDFEMASKATNDTLVTFYQQEQAIVQSGEPLIGHEISVPSDESDQVTHFSISKFPLRGINGEITSIIGINYDITERKEAELALQRFNQRLTILHEIDKNIIMGGSSEKIVDAVLESLRQLIDCERATVVLFDEQTEEIVVLGTASGIKSIVQKGVRVSVKEDPRIEVYKAGKPVLVQDTAKMETPDSDIWNNLVNEGIRSFLATPLIMHGHMIGNLNILSKIPYFFTSEYQEIAQEVADQLAIGLYQANLREELEQTNINLEERVAERTTQLEAKNHELETFTYTVSHDLKAPLRGIDGYSRLLLADHVDQLDDEGRLFLQNIRTGTDQMNQLIDDLLTYSQLERRGLRTLKFNVRQLVESLVSERAADISLSGAIVTVSLPDIVIFGDSDGLAMALRNLLDNALKFSIQTEKPMITISGHETESSCILWVQDNGIGFDMKYHDRILQMFQRLHRAEDYSGTGIGLAIVSKAMDRMNGHVWAESIIGKGSTFYLEIPK